MTTHIIGGGIAGLASALALRNIRNNKIIIYDKNEATLSQASKKNAAIARTFEADPEIANICEKNMRFLKRLEKRFSKKFLNSIGLVIDPLELDYNKKLIEKSIEIGESHYQGYWLEEDGYFELETIHQWFREQLKKYNIQIKTNVRLHSLTVAKDKVSELVFNHGSFQFEPEDVIINAAGANLNQFMPGKLHLPVYAHKRHLFTFDKAIESPVVWLEKSETYFRPENSCTLITHGDESLCDPLDLEIDEQYADQAIIRLRQMYSFLKDSTVVETRACLRSFSRDQRLVLGFHPQIDNLFYVAGLAGYGISIAFALILEIRKSYYNFGTDCVLNPFSISRFIE